MPFTILGFFLLLSAILLYFFDGALIVYFVSLMFFPLWAIWSAIVGERILRQNKGSVRGWLYILPATLIIILAFTVFIAVFLFKRQLGGIG